MDIVDKCVLVAVVVHDSKYIYIGNGVAYNLAFCLKFVEQNILSLVFFGHLELKNLGIFHHHIVEIFAYFPCVSLQNLTSLAHVFLIFFVALLVDARRSAVVYVIVETGLVFSVSDAFSCQRKATSAGFVELFDDFKYCIHTSYVRIRSVECSYALVDVSCFENSRERLVGYANRRVSLAVFQQNVVFRVVFLDQAVFQQ